CASAAGIGPSHLARIASQKYRSSTLHSCLHVAAPDLPARCAPRTHSTASATALQALLPCAPAASLSILVGHPLVSSGAIPAAARFQIWSLPVRHRERTRVQYLEDDQKLQKPQESPKRHREYLHGEIPA